MSSVEDIAFQLMGNIPSTVAGPINILVMNQLDPIEELYDMYSEEEDALRIVEIEDDGLDFLSDVDRLADPYMDL